MWTYCLPISFNFQFKLFQTGLGSVRSSLLRTGSARLTEPGPKALTVGKNPKSSDCHKLLYGRNPRGLTVRKYPTGETQELALTTLKELNAHILIALLKKYLFSFSFWKRVKVKVEVERNLVL